MVGDLAVRIAPSFEIGSHLVVGPFDDHVRRPKVQSAGAGDMQAYWRLDGQDSVEPEDLRVIVVLRVPKGEIGRCDG